MTRPYKIIRCEICAHVWGRTVCGGGPLPSPDAYECPRCNRFAATFVGSGYGDVNALRRAAKNARRARGK